MIPKSVFDFLKKLKDNNTREWMLEHKKDFLLQESILKKTYLSIENELKKTDEISKMKIFRIYRDVRFSKDKTPFNVHRSISLSRLGAHRRGGYYLRLEPGNSYVAGGFFEPNPADLFRIRKEFEMDASEIRQIFEQSEFKEAFKNFDQEYAVKTAPKGFSKEAKNIDLIRLKSFYVVHGFTDAEVLSDDFWGKIIAHFLLLRPFFDYMSEVLTTDLNGVSTLVE